MNILKTYEKKLSITSYGSGLKFLNLYGFEKQTDATGTKYYITDFDANSILIFNDDWSFFGLKNFSTSLGSIRAIKNDLIIIKNPTTDVYLYKTDKSLNVLLSSTSKLMYSYTDAFYDPVKDQIFIVSHNNQKIDVYDRNLAFIRSISLTGNYVRSINGYGSQLFVGTLSGDVLVIENDKIIRSFKACTSLYAYSIQFDQNGNMAVSCYYDKTINLYSLNGVFLNVNKVITNYPTYFDVDSKGRLVVLTSNEIGIYY